MTDRTSDKTEAKQFARFSVIASSTMMSPESKKLTNLVVLSRLFLLQAVSHNQATLKEVLSISISA